MKFKMSLFDRSIFKSDLKRFWWVSALYAVILFFILPLQHMVQTLPLKEDWQKEALLNSLHLISGGAPYYSFRGISPQVLLICTIPVFLAVMLFGYLHSTRAATMFSSLPLSRKTLLGSHTAAGMLLISAPVFITAAVLAVIAAFTGLGEYYSVVNALEWMALSLLYNMLFFSIAVFVGMFTGSVIAHLAFTYIINILPYGLYVLVAYNLEILLHGFSTYRVDVGWAEALPFVKLIGFTYKDFTIIQGLLYLVIACIFLWLAGVAYNGRKLETAGNIVAFRTVQPVFKYGVAVCLMLSAGFITGYLNHSGSTAVITAYFIFALIGYWVSQMLLEKTVRVWFAYKGFLIFNAILLLLLTGISADVTGYARRIPSLDEIQSAYYGNSYNSWLSEKNKLPELESFRRKGLFREEANIKAVTDLHRVLAVKKNDEFGRQAFIGYLLKNGKSIVREYTVDEYAARELLKPLYESLEYKEDAFPVLGQEAKDIKWIEIGDRRTGKKPQILSDEKQVLEFIDILKKELANADYREVTEPEERYAYIQIADTNDRKYYYGLRGSFEELNSWLEVNGYYGSVMLDPAEIDHVDVQLLKTAWYRGSIGYSGIDTDMDWDDPALIKELVEICSPSLHQSGDGIYLRLNFYLQANGSPSFEGFIRPDTPMSDLLKQKLNGLEKVKDLSGN